MTRASIESSTIFEYCPHHPVSGLLGVMLPIAQRFVALAVRVLLGLFFQSDVACGTWRASVSFEVFMQVPFAVYYRNQFSHVCNIFLVIHIWVLA